MGLFNHIRPGPYCPRCGGDMDWQAKELYIREFPIANRCILMQLEPDVSGEAHTNCNACEWWHEARIDCGRMTIVESGPILVAGKPPRSRQMGFTYLDCQGNRKTRERI